MCSNFRVHRCKNPYAKFSSHLSSLNDGGMLQYAMHIQLADDCLDSYSQYRPFFVHIQLAVDCAKNYYSLCSVTL